VKVKEDPFGQREKLCRLVPPARSDINRFVLLVATLTLSSISPNPRPLPHPIAFVSPSVSSLTPPNPKP
ncbi:hypothetical protein Dimus_007078, partial [Dionaea muscipula]